MKAAIAMCVFLIAFHLNLNAFQRQKTLNWCWASCVQDVLSNSGVEVSQEQVAARLDGWAYDRPAAIGEIVSLLRSYDLGAWQAGRPGSPEELKSCLGSGWKL